MPINLLKNFYGANEAKENLDRNFKEFLPKSLSPSVFFELYEKHFYNITDNIHNEFITRSMNYAYPEGWVNPRQIELEALQEQVQGIKDQIDSIEKEHPFFKNGTFLMDITYKDNPQAAILEGKTYYMQSKKKRKINNSTAYQNLKNKIRKRLDQSEGTIEDSNFITFIDIQTLNGISTGPPIEKTTDVYVPILEINRYGQTTELET
tara:strand:- start:5551 stop:6171 length:621 start_codon:yes stop_codon:yes gene_type:complete